MERKVCFILDAGNPGGGRTPVQRPATPDPQQPVRKSFYRQREGATCRNNSQLWRSSWNWSCGGLTSIILIVLSTVNLQFQGQFAPISLSPILRIVAAYVMVTVWSSCSSLLLPGGGFSIYNIAHRIWLRILSMAHEEELKVLDYAWWLLLFSLGLFSFVSEFSHSLIKFIL